MNCDWEQLDEKDARGRRLVRCRHCATVVPHNDNIHSHCRARPGDDPPPVLLTDAELSALFPTDDPTLLGNRVAALTKAIGIPPCAACEARGVWLNRAHIWVRENLLTPKE